MLVIVCLLLFVIASPLPAQDWPQWRGPTGDNHASAGATAPVEWSENAGLAWRTPLPGRGHSSPTIVGDRVYLTTAEQQAGTQSLLVIDKRSGKLLKQTVAHRGGLPAQVHPNNSHASPTVACDGQRVFTLFYNSSGAWVTALDLSGEQLWQRKVCAFDPQRYQFGFGPSPRVEGGLLIVAAEYDGAGSGLYALDPFSGRQVWRAERPENITFSTPITTTLAGRRQLLLSGSDQIASYDPASGNELWSTAGATRATCGTMIWDRGNGLAFASGGYPNSFTQAVKADGSGQIVWQHPVKCYEQSMLFVDEHVYAVADSGAAYCWRASDGEEMWRKRLGGKYSSSPLLVGDVIFVSSESGTTHVFRATPDRFEPLAENQLGDDCFPTTTPSAGRLYHRYGQGSGDQRQEYLVAIGE